ncbi:hypothetical protein Hanom_Chr07g00594391 [Helianthus anomalus]
MNPSSTCLRNYVYVCMYVSERKFKEYVRERVPVQLQFRNRNSCTIRRVN